MNDETTLVTSAGAWDHALRVAKMYADSQLVPLVYQKNIPNCIIAMEIAQRMGMPSMLVMQNLDIIHNRPCWNAKFNIATVNASGKFEPLEYEFTSAAQGSPEWGCRVKAIRRADKRECQGPWVTMKTAEAEGWTTRTGSKWKTMPELMMRYRAATWFTRVYAPEMLVGLPMADEVIDAEVDVTPPKVEGKPKGMKALKQAEKVPAAGGEVEEKKDAATEEKKVPAAGETAAEEAPALPLLIQVRSRITGTEEKESRKRDGSLGPVVKATLQNGASAFWNGTRKELPADGKEVVFEVEESTLKGEPALIIRSWKEVAS